MMALWSIKHEEAVDNTLVLYLPASFCIFYIAPLDGRFWTASSDSLGSKRSTDPDSIV